MNSGAIKLTLCLIAGICSTLALILSVPHALHSTGSAVATAINLPCAVFAYSRLIRG